ncbi:MAG: hypothetical protein JWL69_369 [Phycisphaerales bacterium]|jgi:SMODS-associating 2TM, beta-strand rich effector domain|nr:hypothetical protein [Phycisphaerales bacterium]MDB5357152.1 hypothetical protein [Phycisphaerales bacterium]
MSPLINVKWILSILAGVTGLAVVLSQYHFVEVTRLDWNGWKGLAGLALSGVTPTAIFYFVFDRWVWKWSVFQGWLVKYPDLSGIWEGTSVSDTFGGQLAVRLFIRQRAGSLLAQEETGAALNVGNVVMLFSRGQRCFLCVTYLSSRAGARKPNTDYHEGTCVLELKETDGSGATVKSRLVGTYWTNKIRCRNGNGVNDAGTTGSLDLTWTKRLPRTVRFESGDE